MIIREQKWRENGITIHRYYYLRVPRYGPNNTNYIVSYNTAVMHINTYYIICLAGA